jgi:hypothetical protein
MKFSELEVLINDYYPAKYSPSRMEVHFGCDCGCGGDRFTRESWDAEEKEAQEAIDKMKEFCHNMGIKYDGVE